MALSNELKRIKKEYGEKFMHLCRDFFPTLLEQEGLLYEILTSTFSSNSKTLYEDIVKNELELNFKNYIYSKIDVESEEIKKVEDERTPFEILKETGYDLIECKNEKEIQNFKKYYAKGEELCTFGGDRLKRCVVFFAVKKDVEDIKREDFKKPQREDKYGTSVMSIQFEKHGKCTVSIKNRYNHSVNNPDATYGNDLDQIAPGLKESFTRLLSERGLKLDSANVGRLQIPGYTVANDGKYYKCNIEIDGKYYCPGNIIIEKGQVKKIGGPEKNILIDNFIVDLENKSISQYNEEYYKDSFTDDLIDIEKIEVEKDKEQGDGIRVITIKKKEVDFPIKITIDKNNAIIGYENEKLKQVGDLFLSANRKLNQLKIPNLMSVENDFLQFNEELNNLDLPKLRYAGNSFLERNEKVIQANLPELREIGSDSLINAFGLQKIICSKLKYLGNNSLERVPQLKNFEAPELIKMGKFCLCGCRKLKVANIPNLRETGNRALEDCLELKDLEAPNLEKIGDCSFGSANKDIKRQVKKTVRENIKKKNEEQKESEVELVTMEDMEKAYQNTSPEKRKSLLERIKKRVKNRIKEKEIKESEIEKND